MTTYASPRFDGTASKNSRKASIPPAEAPIPTTVVRRELVALSLFWLRFMLPPEYRLRSSRTRIAVTLW